MKMKKIRILVVDDENVVREGFVAILRLAQDVQVVGEARDGIQAVEVARKTKPDIVLLDLSMPRQDGLATIPQIKELLPDTRILVLTGTAESDRVFQALKSGALGFLLKDTTRVQLLQAIREVANGQASIQPNIAVRVIQEINHQGVSILLVEQNSRKALTASRRGYLIENGKVVLEGSSSELLETNHLKRAYLGI